MIFKESALAGAFVIEPERKSDLRGYFARTFCEREFIEKGLKSCYVQCNVSFNKLRGTLRGMHYQVAPMEEAKLVRCTRGEIFDVIIDLRRDSPTYKRYFGLPLSAENGVMLYIPEGFAHGFQTMQDDSEVFYQMSQFYAADLQRGVRWNDPAFAIQWPECEARTVIQRDQEYPLMECD